MENVAYLEVDDFNSDGSLKSYVYNGKPVVVMAQGTFCGYCTQAKPAFVKFAKNNPKILAATITIDGEESEKAASKFIGKLDKSYRGVPTYLGFNSDGKYTKTHSGGRDTDSIAGFAVTL